MLIFLSFIHTHTHTHTHARTHAYIHTGVAGVIGASTVFPLDMAKTRLQNQKVGPNGERMYNGFLDAIRKIARTEGPRGLYQGLVPNLVGIIPEKAIKLGVNDFLRMVLADEEDGSVSLGVGAAAGGLAGLTQCVATNPMEIVKIRLQTASLEGVKLSPMQAVNELGIKGLYRGAPATLARDIPFSVAFFALYGHLKDTWATDADGNTSFGKVLVSGMGAGMLGAALSTPPDVVKTRLQIKDAKHTSMVAQTKDILANEGAAALFKGVVPRMMIIGPLFAITLFSYEVQKWMMVKLGWTNSAK